MHKNSRKIGVFITALGDIGLLFASLYLGLSVRNLSWATQGIWQLHFAPFGRAFIVWIAVFIMFGLYDIRITKNSSTFMRRLIQALFITALATTLIFYFDPTTKLTPKTILFLTILFSAGFLVLWRSLFNSILAASSKNRVLFFGVTKEVAAMAHHLTQNPQFGYEPVALMRVAGDEEGALPAAYPSYAKETVLKDIILRHSIDTIVVSANIRENKELVRTFFDIVPLGRAIVEFPEFYESITGKIPVSLICEVWFLEHLVGGRNRLFELTERLIDLIGALALLGPALLLTPLVALAVRLDSRGPVFYFQKRIGKNNKLIEIIKIRTMVADAERGVAKWADENDPRVTRIGSILRKTRLDEIPQIWNVLKGDLSFVGPRPERPEFVELLQTQIPFYDMRHLVTPGLTGWAQINFPYGASVQDALEKLQYDLYYIKNQSQKFNEF